MTSSDVIGTLGRLVEAYGIPDFIGSDNGPEFVARAVNVTGHFRVHHFGVRRFYVLSVDWQARNAWVSVR
jgi:hypothetical protein